MAQDYLDDIVQKIVTRCDLGGFYELNVAIEDAAKKARSLSRSMGNLVTGEQKVKIAELNNERTKTLLLLEQERNAISENRLELKRLTNEITKNNNETKIQTQERDKQLSSDRLQNQLSKERTAQIKKETAELKRQNVVRKESNWLYRQAGRLLLTYFSFHTLRGIVETGSRIQLVQKSIEGLTKSTQDWDYIQQQAFRTGTEIEVVAKGYRNFFSSAKMAGFGKEGIQGMYADVLLATRSIGASTQQTEGALLALEQMLSKGTVSMEELRRQLGNAIPGAFEIGAKAMNMTTKEFNQFVKTGKLASSEFVPKFIKALKDTYADGFKNIEQTVSVAQVRLSNSWKLLQADIMSGEAGKSFASALDTLRQTLDSPEFKQFIQYLGQIFKLVVQIFNFIIKNMRLVLVLLGVRGFYGVLLKHRSLWKLMTMDIGRAFIVMKRFVTMGRLGFGAMSAASLAFMKTLFRVLLPLMAMEDLVFFLGETFLGWNTKSAIGAAVASVKGKNGDMSLGDQMSDRVQKWTNQFDPASQYYKKGSKGYKELKEAIDRRDYAKIKQMTTGDSIAPIGGYNNVLDKQETNNISVNIGDININANSNEPDKIAQSVQDVLLNTLTSINLTKNTQGTVTA